MAVQDDDKFIVNRGGTDYKVSASDLDDKLQDDDQVLINRGGTDYKVSGIDLRVYLGIVIFPWDDWDVIYHVIVDDPNDISVRGSRNWAIYNKETREQSSINAPGEWIITTNADEAIRFYSSPGNWEFGPLTDTSQVTDMSDMFADCSLFNSSLRYFDMSNVTDMKSMFNAAEEFDQDIGDWNLSNVTNGEKVFQRAYKFNQDIGNWDVSNFTGFYNLFNEAHAFNQDIGRWDTSGVNAKPNARFDSMFWNAKAFNQDLRSWCVSNISYEKPNFKLGSAMPTDGSKDPIWGTCPRGEDKP